MKKLLTMVLLFLTFLVGGFTASGEESADKILNVEILAGYETVADRIDTLGHMALFMHDNVNLENYINENTADEGFIEVLNEIAYTGRSVDSATYNYLLNIIDIGGLETELYYAPVTIVNTKDTTKEIVTDKKTFETVVRVTYKTLSEYVSVDIPFVDYENGNIDVNPFKAVITVGQGGNTQVIHMTDDEAQLYYLIVKALEEVYHYEMSQDNESSPFLIGMDAFPVVTDESVLNQSVEKDIASYDNDQLKKLSSDFSIRYSSFAKGDNGVGDEYVYFIFFGKGDFTYRISCSREGRLALNVYEGSGGFLYYSIPTLEYPYDILTEDMQGEQSLINLNDLTDRDVEVLRDIEVVLQIFEKMSKETDLKLGI